VSVENEYCVFAMQIGRLPKPRVADDDLLEALAPIVERRRQAQALTDRFRQTVFTRTVEKSG